MPPEWSYLHIMVPVKDGPKHPKWVDLKIERNDESHLKEAEISKYYTISNSGDWNVEITPWLEDRNIIKTDASPSELIKNKLGESTYTFSESKQHTLELILSILKC